MTVHRKRRACGLVAFPFFALAALLAAVPGQAKTNFSGEWKMNTSKSEYGPMPAPTSRTDKITHEDPSLNVKTTQSGPNGDATVEFKYATDGTETTNELRGSPMKATAKWDGDTLVINTKATFGGMEITLADKWSVSADGKVLTVNRHIVSPQGELDQKMVFEKQ